MRAVPSAILENGLRIRRSHFSRLKLPPKQTSSEMPRLVFFLANRTKNGVESGDFIFITLGKYTIDLYVSQELFLFV